PIPSSIQTLADYSKGAADAPIQVLEFSDFQCPYCRNLFASLEPILERYKESTRVTLLNFPIDNSCNPQIPRPGHQFACYSASFAICAGEQGRFWDTVQYLFTLPELEGSASRDAGIAAINGAMLRLSLDSDGMRECLGSNRPAKRLSTDIQAAVSLGIQGTPLVVINGRAVANPTPDTIEAIFAKIIGTKPRPAAAKAS
ncbi:MAG: hypothetical protein EBZ48_04875, partial [Proteobacteria bacterium]|nr:hypothetical protein [Pseudomonadota bacterium]